MAARIKIEVLGKTEFDRSFSRLDENFKDLSFLWNDVRDEFWLAEKEQFQSGGAKGASGKWKPLSKRYEAQKIKRYGTYALIAGTLHATEALYKSLTGATSDSVYLTSKTEIAIGTSLPYAKFHQTGGRNLPAREVISLSDLQKKRLQKTIQRGLVKQLRQSGATYIQTDIGDF